ncbi:MAG: SDR family NAD(P)-dependent oxidoreductase, partial [Opitutaceae bacterium]
MPDPRGEFLKKVVVITGGSRGIGRGIAAAFAAEGAQTVLVASSQVNLEAAADAITATGALRPDICDADLRRETDCKAVFEHVSSRHGRCDILINSAGATKAGAFLEQPLETWHDGFALKFFGCVTLCRLFWPMLKTSRGHVVNIIGVAARSPDPLFLIGGSVNGAMHNFTKGLSALGKQDGINVNAVLPGMIETERVEQLIQQRAAASGRSPAEQRAAQIAAEGILRPGQPEDVAALV